MCNFCVSSYILFKILESERINEFQSKNILTGQRPGRGDVEPRKHRKVTSIAYVICILQQKDNFTLQLPLQKVGLYSTRSTQ